MVMRAELRKKKIFKDSMKKMSITSERFAYKVHADEMIIFNKIVKKMLKHNSECEDSLPALFKSLDEGAAIDISGINDSYVQSKLYKMFKIMRLRKSKGNELEFRKKVEKDIHKFSFARFIDYVIKYVQEEKDSSSENEEDDDEISDLGSAMSDEDVVQNADNISISENEDEVENTTNKTSLIDKMK